MPTDEEAFMNQWFHFPEPLLSSPPLPPTEGGVSLRTVEDPNSEVENYVNVSLLRTDIDGKTESIRDVDQHTTSYYRDAIVRTEKGSHDSIFFQNLDPLTSFGLVPGLSPDSSPASVASSSMLMTPEGGISLSDIQSPSVLTPYYEDDIFWNPENSLGFGSDFFGYSHYNALEDTICSSTEELMNRSSVGVPSTSLLFADSEWSEAQDAPSLQQPHGTQSLIVPDVYTTGDGHSGSSPIPGSTVSRCLPVPKHFTEERNPTPSPYYSTSLFPLPPTPSTIVCNDEDEAGLQYSTPAPRMNEPIKPSLGLSPDPGSTTGRRCTSRRSEDLPDDDVDGDDDDDDYIPLHQQSCKRESLLSKGGQSSAALSGNGSSRSKRRQSKKTRSSSSAKPSYRCKDCGTTFSRQGDIQRHQKSLACKVLSRQAVLNGTLSEAKWKCRICGDSLSRADSLRRHEENAHPNHSVTENGLRPRKRAKRAT